MSNIYKVWECKIVVPADVELPCGFDSPPRMAALNAVMDQDIPVLSCFSGWSGSLDKYEEASVDKEFEKEGIKASNIKIDKNFSISIPLGWRTKYPFRDLDVGDSFFVEGVGAELVRSSARSCARLHNMKFTTRTVEGGCRCWRIK